MDKKLVVILAVIIGVLAAAFIVMTFIGTGGESTADEAVQMNAQALVPSTATTSDSFTFACPDGKMFTTTYNADANAITLVLEGDMAYVLPQAVTASGARYQSADGKVVFWEHQGKAMVEVDGAKVHEECVVKS